MAKEHRPEDIAALCEEAAERDMDLKNYREACGYYRQIIWCIDPQEVDLKASEVIQKFTLTVSREPYLIEYLETLHQFYCKQHELSGGRAYTQLLFDCYIKMGKFEKVDSLIEGKDIDFLEKFLDIDRSINMLRESPKTVEYAVKVARNAEKWDELIKIYFEHRKVSEIC